MKLFKSPRAVIEEINRLQTDEAFRREDRAIVSDFYNGAPPLTDEEAERLGFSCNVNHLFGYNELSQSADIIKGLYIKPEHLVRVELDAAPPGKRTDWGMWASEEASRVFRGIRSFGTAYNGVAGDSAMHGEGVFFFPDTTFPLPRQCALSKMLIPGDATTNPEELSHFGVETTLTLRQLSDYYKRAGKGWKAANLKKVLDKIYEGCFTDGRDLDATNLEEAEYRRQENGAKNDKRRASCEVTYFYQQRADLFGAPYDLTISLRGGDPTSASDRDAFILYEGEQVFPRIGACLHPVFMDCIIGGIPKWHRTLGTGHLNYQINHSIELLVNRAKQATIEGSMNLWQAKDTTTREAIQQILLKHNGVLPEGMSLVPNRFEPNFGGILDMIQFYRQAGGKNARGTTPNNGDKNDMLEVQAIAEQNAAANSGENRTANCYDYLDGMYEEGFARLTNDLITENECGYSQVMDFQTAMKRRGVPLWWLRRANVKVAAVRIVGNGVRSKEVAVVQFLTANRANYAPEVQPKITRLCTGLALNDYKLAAELTPIQDEPDAPQQMRADSENAIMLTTRQPQAPKADDIDELHVVQHFPGMEVLIQDALKFQKAAFTPQQAEAFQIIGGHILAHVERIEKKALNSRKDPDRELAAQMKKQLNDLAAMGEKLVHNMQQGQQGQEQEPMDQTDMAKLQLQAEQLQFQREKLAHKVAMDDRKQGHREQNDAFNQMQKLHDSKRQDTQHSFDIFSASRESRRKEIETAGKLAIAAQPSNSGE